MIPLANLIGMSIGNILRLDTDEDYDFFSPLGIYLKVTDKKGIFLGARNDGKAVDVEVKSYHDFYADSGVEYFECFLNALKKEDELNLMIGETITGIELAEYSSQSILGETFIISQGKYAGIRIRTTGNELTYFNESGGQAWINLNYDIPNQDRWTLKVLEK